MIVLAFVQAFLEPRTTTGIVAYLTIFCLLYTSDAADE